MSLQMNEITMQNQEFVEYAPPEYDDITAIPKCHENTVPPNEHPWNEYTQPPAYDALPDLPIWSIPLSDSESDMSFRAQQWNVDSQIPSYSVISTSQYQRPNAVVSQTSEISLFKYKFWKSPPAIAGVLLLLASFVQVGAGTILASTYFSHISYSLTYGIPFWSTVCHLFTGSLSITAHAKPFTCQVQSSLFFNILTIILSSVGIVFNVKDVEALCRMSNSPYPQNQISGFNVHYVLISSNVALLCLSVSAAIFGSWVLCRSSRKNPQESVIENGCISLTGPSDLSEASLASPPPYTPQEVYTGRTTQ